MSIMSFAKTVYITRIEGIIPESERCHALTIFYYTQEKAIAYQNVSDYNEFVKRFHC